MRLRRQGGWDQVGKGLECQVRKGSNLCQNYMGELVKMKIPGPARRDSDSVSLGCGLGTRILTKSPGVMFWNFECLLIKHILLHLQHATGLGGKSLGSSP